MLRRGAQRRAKLTYCSSRLRAIQEATLSMKDT